MNERKECVEDDPDAQLSEHLWHLMLGEHHPYGHPTIGWMSDIEQLSLDDCQRFYQRFYAPDHDQARKISDRSADNHLS